MKHRMTRREFLRGAGLGAAGLALASCQPKEEAATATPVAPQKTTISIFNYDPTGTDAWVVADGEFDEYFAEKYPNIEITMDQAPWTGLWGFADGQTDADPITSVNGGRGCGE